ncbi:hypothetical protein HC256_001770 [Beauveria bassiana]|nr:hypothetical protein HC256_001770 [Beauveria bassiana]
MPIDQFRPDAPRPHPDPNQGREPTVGELECYQNDDTSFTGMERNVAKASGNHPGDPTAEDRCYTSEFDKLVEMGKEILPLVNYMLLNDDNFTAVFLYNALEDDTRYRVDPDDVLNFLTLQRQQNLIVDLNRDRKW